MLPSVPVRTSPSWAVYSEVTLARLTIVRGVRVQVFPSLLTARFRFSKKLSAVGFATPSMVIVPTDELALPLPIGAWALTPFVTTSLVMPLVMVILQPTSTASEPVPIAAAPPGKPLPVLLTVTSPPLMMMSPQASVRLPIPGPCPSPPPLPSARTVPPLIVSLPPVLLPPGTIPVEPEYCAPEPMAVTVPPLMEILFPTHKAVAPSVLKDPPVINTSLEICIPLAYELASLLVYLPYASTLPPFCV